MTSMRYMKGESEFLSGNIDLLNDTIKLALLGSAYSPSQSHNFWSDVSANEVSSAGYTAGGAALASKSLTATAADSWATAWAASTAYSVGDVVRPTTGNGFVYECVAAGTSGASEPTWSTVIGQTVTDGTATWVCRGRFVVVFDAADPSWSGVTFTTRYGVLYKDTGSPSTSPLIAVLDWGVDKSPSAETFTVQFDVNGVLRYF